MEKLSNFPPELVVEMGEQRDKVRDWAQSYTPRFWLEASVFLRATHKAFW